MKKFNTSPISGTQELLPGLQAEFNRLKDGIVSAFAHHGYQNIETPVIDRTEILLAKAGGDTEKQIYKVIKTAEAADGADQALRFDHTVPLSRYIVEHANDLTFPFKVFQVGRNFRGERAQKGRFREFYQCDVDVIGWQKLPISYDADVISTLLDALNVLPINKILVRISNRKILNGLLAGIDLQHQAGAIFDIIDHAEKVPEEVTLERLQELNIGSESIERIVSFSKISGHRSDAVKALRGLGVENDIFAEGVDELDEVLALLESKLNDRVDIVADMLIVRGLDYYTGTVFETVALEYREVGSICSGGRYENLAGHYTDQSLPGAGGSIGLTRLFYVLRELGLVTDTNNRVVDLCIVPISENEFITAEQLADKLREMDYSVDINLTDKKFGDKMKYAEKVAGKVVVVGEDEIKSGKYIAKNFATGEQEDLVVE